MPGPNRQFGASTLSRKTRSIFKTSRTPANAGLAPLSMHSALKRNWLAVNVILKAASIVSRSPMHAGPRQPGLTNQARSPNAPSTSAQRDVSLPQARLNCECISNNLGQDPKSAWRLPGLRDKLRSRGGNESRHCWSDGADERLRPVFRSPEASRGGRPAGCERDNTFRRTVASGMDAPAVYGRRKTPYNRFGAGRAGVFAKIVRRSPPSRGRCENAHDRQPPMLKAQPDGRQPLKRGIARPRAIGRNQRRRNSKLHRVANGWVGPSDLVPVARPDERCRRARLVLLECPAARKEPLADKATKCR